MSALHPAVTTVIFSQSTFPPIAVGFFGLATGYLPNALMSIAFIALSALGVVVFFHHGADDPVGGVFIGLTAVYVSEFFATLGVPLATKALGFFRLGTAGWLLYLTWAAALNFSAGYHLPL